MQKSNKNEIFMANFYKFLSFEVCFCRDILPSFCLVQLFTSASNGIRLKTLLVSRIRILSVCPVFDLLRNNAVSYWRKIVHINTTDWKKLRR